MSANKITTYQQNTKTIQVDVSGNTLANLVGFTPYLTVKIEKDGAVIIENTGSVDGLQITFTVPYADNSIAADDYIYDVMIESSTAKYTLLQDSYVVVDSVKY